MSMFYEVTLTPPQFTIKLVNGLCCVFSLNEWNLKLTGSAPLKDGLGIAADWSL